MKKVLSFVLVLAMILGSVSMAFADTALIKDVQGLDCEEAVNVLTGLGVVEGFEDGLYHPEKGVTRAQMVKLIIAALALPVKEGTFTTNFTDVEPSAWYSAYVYYAFNLGIVEGKSATIFDPNGAVTYDQAVAMVMRALGYTETSLQGSYPTCFINKAVALEALDGLTTGSAPANRADMAQLIYNVLEQTIGKVNDDNEWVASLGASGYDRMLTRLGATATETFVMVDKDMIEDEDTLVDLSEYLGAVVSLYVNEDDEIVAVDEIKTTAITGNYDKTDSTITYGGYKLYGKTAWTEATTSTGVLASYTEFKNGDIATTAFTDAELTDSDVEYTINCTLKSGKIDKVYSVVAWFVDADAKVGSSVQDDIDDKELCGKEFALDDDDEIDLDSFILNGVDSLADIEEDDIVFVYCDSEGKIARVDVCDEVLEGTLDEIKNSTKVIFDGETYKTHTADLFVSTDLDAEFKAYLGYDGKIYAKKDITNDSGYVVLLAAENKDTTKIETSHAKVKVLCEDGTTKIYTCASALDTTTFKSIVSAGDLAKLTLNSSDKVTAIEIFTDNNPAETVSSKGVTLESTLVNSATIVFAYDGDGIDYSDEDDYTVVDYSTLLGAENFDMTYAVKSGKVKAALVEGVATEDDTFVVFTGNGSEVEDFWKAEVLANGEKITYKFDQEFFGSNPKSNATTSAAPTLYKLTFQADGTVKAANPAVEPVETDDLTSVAINLAAVTESSTLDGDLLKIGSTYYELNDVVVYNYDSSKSTKWTVKSESALGGLRDSKAQMVVLYDTTDDDKANYDIAVIFVK